jgi:hypothetical protein
MFAALHCETIGHAHVRFSVKRTFAFARWHRAFRTLARVLNRRKQTGRNPRRFIPIVANTLILTGPVATARTDVDEDLITLLNPAPTCPLQSDEP